ncbi:phytoene desaturase family protein [Micromonospora marina]|uniref:phytoene desaturase family protein n=1 Tax=Micromonospora marina TaxID=307120 RepID=UPI0034531044
MSEPDVVVVGSGPNGLAAAVLLSRAGLRVAVHEAAGGFGGGARTGEPLGTGVRHDHCSTVHPMAAASPFFRAFDLTARGVDLLRPEVAYAHPLDGGRAGLAWTDLERTVEGLGVEGRRWRRMFAPLIARWPEVAAVTLSDLRDPAALISPAAVLLGAGVLEQRLFPQGGAAGAMLAGVNLHGVVRPDGLAATAVGTMLGLLAHTVGWPLPRGGSQAITDAMVADIRAHGGTLTAGTPVHDIRDLPRARAVVLNAGPAVLARVAGPVLPRRYLRRLARYRYGAGSCTVDFLLSGPVPWTAPGCDRAGTLHLAGTRAEAISVQRTVASGRHAPRPYVLVTQPSAVGDIRAPRGLQTLSAYAHVPAGSDVDVSDAVIGQIERFAPGFRDLVIARHVRTAAQLGSDNANYVGGDITSGRLSLHQLALRPRSGVDPFTTPVPGLYHCSAASPPGPGVHGMAGLHAARRVLRDRFGIATDPLTLLTSPERKPS